MCRMDDSSLSSQVPPELVAPHREVHFASDRWRFATLVPLVALVWAGITACTVPSTADPVANVESPALCASADEQPQASRLEPIAAGTPVTEVLLEPDSTLTRCALYGAEARGIDFDTLQGYRGLGTLTVWTGTMEDRTSHCVLLKMNAGAGFSDVTCAALAEPVTLSILVEKGTPIHIATGEPVGTTLTFEAAVEGILLRAANG